MKFYSPAELAAILKIEEELILCWLEHGELTGFKIENVWRIEEKHFEAFLERHCNNKSIPDVQKGKVSKYVALTEHLSKIDNESITMSFEEIEKIIDMKLPRSARLYRSWWSNCSKTHVQALGWLNGQKKVMKVDLKNNIVVFGHID